MGEKATLAKARKELEEMYLGIPDDSVNLTFQHLADVTQNISDHKKKPNQALQASNNHHHHHLDHKNGDLFKVHHHHSLGGDESHHGHRNHAINSKVDHSAFGHAMEGSIAHDDASVMSMASMYQERGGRRRPGIPHSNICTICSTYIYIFRSRCLVCGRVYCRQCVGIGMGEMTEGRKCIECLGRRFSQRYIQRAGKVGCWIWRYPSMLKQAELMWAEKGPRRTDRRYGHNGMMSSRPRSPMTPRAHVDNNPPSFVMGSPYSPYSSTPTHHHLPF
uniref:Uncharacterized protein n=1 Tax=Fagus sylvatica TaxID=28930 RepID=A0A2N9J3U2_FAGSY